MHETEKIEIKLTEGERDPNCGYDLHFLSYNFFGYSLRSLLFLDRYYVERIKKINNNGGTVQNASGKR